METWFSAHTPLDQWKDVYRPVGKSWIAQGQNVLLLKSVSTIQSDNKSSWYFQGHCWLRHTVTLLYITLPQMNSLFLCQKEEKKNTLHLLSFISQSSNSSSDAEQDFYILSVSGGQLFIRKYKRGIFFLPDLMFTFSCTNEIIFFLPDFRTWFGWLKTSHEPGMTFNFNSTFILFHRVPVGIFCISFGKTFQIWQRFSSHFNKMGFWVVTITCFTLNYKTLLKGN